MQLLSAPIQAGHTQPHQVLGQENRGLIIVFSGPSGSGKTTLVRRLLAGLREPGSLLDRSVSFTTRPARPGEVGGEDYCFVSEGCFSDMLAAGEFLEHSEIYGHRYGTRRKDIDGFLANGATILLVLDAQGRQQIAKTFGDRLVSVFLLPPSLQELTSRLHGRNQEDQTLARRLAAARHEIAGCLDYDYVIRNRDLEMTHQVVAAILRAEHTWRRKCVRPGI